LGTLEREYEEDQQDRESDVRTSGSSSGGDHGKGPPDFDDSNLNPVTALPKNEHEALVLLNARRIGE
jgi:hypothetical protein